MSNRNKTIIFDCKVNDEPLQKLKEDLNEIADKVIKLQELGISKKNINKIFKNIIKIYGK